MNPFDYSVLWARGVGDPRILIAVLDGPVDTDHPCFVGAQFQQLRSAAVEGLSPGARGDLHGTRVASIIFAQHGACADLRGVAPGCRGISIPIFRSDGAGGLAPSSQQILADGIERAVEAGAHIINISSGELAPVATAALERAVALCAERGVLIVAAAGNDGCECAQMPAALPTALAVGAADDHGQPVSFSNWGRQYAAQGILAPGVGVRCAGLDAMTTAVASGTSFAAPIVSGVAALLLSMLVRNNHSPDAGIVREVLLQTADACHPDDATDCKRHLAGGLNVPRAMAALVDRLTSPSYVAANAPPPPQAPPGTKPVTAEDQIMSQVIASPSPTDGSADTHAQHAASAALTEDAPGVIAAQVPSAEPAVALLDPSAKSTPSGAPSLTGMTPAECECGKSAGQGVAAPTWVYVLGTLAFDYGSEARRDSFAQLMGPGKNPHDPQALLEHLEANPYQAPGIIWTLKIDGTPVYSIVPTGAFAASGYERLRTYLASQLAGRVHRVSVPGRVMATQTLTNGTVLPALGPVLRGMYSWATHALVQSIAGARPKRNTGEYDRRVSDVHNFLERIYFDLRNMGQTPADRALNFAATNAFQVHEIFKNACGKGQALEDVTVEKSPIARPGSDCWDVKLTFFNPVNRLQEASEVHRFTVDVSDVVPVTIGPVRTWHAH